MNLGCSDPAPRIYKETQAIRELLKHQPVEHSGERCKLNIQGLKTLKASSFPLHLWAPQMFAQQ